MKISKGHSKKEQPKAPKERLPTLETVFGRHSMKPELPLGVENLEDTKKPAESDTHGDT